MLRATIRLGASPEQTEEYVLKVHGIYPPIKDEVGDEGALLVTRYSYLHKSFFFSMKDNSSVPLAAEKDEILLHFEDFDSMGLRHDASIIPIHAIVNLKAVCLRHTVGIPERKWPSKFNVLHTNSGRLE